MSQTSSHCASVNRLKGNLVFVFGVVSYPNDIDNARLLDNVLIVR